jgi:hypothetical protein
MPWYLDTTRIFVQKLEGSQSQIIPRLQPLSGGTVLQFFGYEDEITKVTCKVVGSGDLGQLTDMSIDYSYHTLSGPDNYVKDYYVKSISHNRLPTRAQTIRTDLDCYESIYDVEIEFYV